MKKAINAVLLVAMVAASTPALAKHHYVFDGQLLNGAMKGQVVEFDRWSEAKCQLYPQSTTKQRRKVLQNCIGRFSKESYSQTLTEFQGRIGKQKKVTKAQAEAFKLATKAILHPDIKWVSKGKQKTLDDLKLGGMITGSIAAAVVVAIIFWGAILSTPVTGSAAGAGVGTYKAIS